MALLTVGGTWGLYYRQRRKASEDAKALERVTAYQELLNASMPFVRRVRALGDTARLRSGFADALETMLGQRERLDHMKLADWTDKEFRALETSWSKIALVGSQDAVAASDRLMTAALEVLTAVEVPTAATRSGRMYRQLVGERWTNEQESKYDSVLSDFADARGSFIHLVRQESGREPVVLGVDRAKNPPPPPQPTDGRSG